MLNADGTYTADFSSTEAHDTAVRNIGTANPVPDPAPVETKPFGDTIHDAVAFLLQDRMRHGDAVAAELAATHLSHISLTPEGQTAAEVKAKAQAETNQKAADAAYALEVDARAKQQLEEQRLAKLDEDAKARAAQLDSDAATRAQELRGLPVGSTAANPIVFDRVAGESDSERATRLDAEARSAAAAGPVAI